LACGASRVSKSNSEVVPSDHVTLKQRGDEGRVCRAMKTFQSGNAKTPLMLNVDVDEMPLPLMTIVICMHMCGLGSHVTMYLGR
jgi:hypothetical protein